MAKSDLTAARLRERLHYDPETGLFRNAPRKYSKTNGRVVGCKTSRGYLRVGLDGHRHLLHRLAWLYVHGEWPQEDIDHINGVRTDNRMANLRLVTDSMNSQNQVRAHSNNVSSGLLGVSYKPSHKQWVARLSLSGKSKHVGYFRTRELAYEAYIEAKRRLHPGCTI